jgi:hypothetical protein
LQDNLPCTNSNRISFAHLPQAFHNSSMGRPVRPFCGQGLIHPFLNHYSKWEITPPLFGSEHDSGLVDSLKTDNMNQLRHFNLPAMNFFHFLVTLHTQHPGKDNFWKASALTLCTLYLSQRFRHSPSAWRFWK